MLAAIAADASHSAEVLFTMWMYMIILKEQYSKSISFIYVNALK